MPRLKAGVQTEVITRLARFERPTEVQEAIRERFNLELSLSRIAHYDPTVVQGRQLAAKWKQLFFEERTRFKSNLDELPLSHRAYRLLRLQRLIDNPNHQRNPVFVRDTIVEVEKIVGDLYSNRRRFEVQDHRAVLAEMLGVPVDELPEPER